MITDDKGVTVELGQRVTLPDGSVGSVVAVGDVEATVALADGTEILVEANGCRVRLEDREA